MTTKPPEEEGFGTDAPTLIRMVSGTSRLIGQILGNQYKIVEVIGEGGIGVVYRARQLTVDRDVAVKVLKKQFANDDLAVRRFENEAAAIGKLRHPNTLRLYDCQRTIEGDLYIVTELLTGQPLADVLRSLKRLPIDRAVRTFDEICRPLAEAHAAGIVHRDLKPANVFLDRIGGEDVVKVLDFGIAKILQGASITRAGPAPGTPQYMSPEQGAAGRIDHRSDIYSLGVILYEMVAGKPPFEGDTAVEILSKHITEKPRSFAEVCPGVEVSAELERLVMWMLEKEPEERPQSIDELRRYVPGILAKATQAPVLVPRHDTVFTAGPHWSDSTAAGVPHDTQPNDVRSNRTLWFSVVTGSLCLILGVVIGYGGDPASLVPAAKPPQAPLVTEETSARHDLSQGPVSVVDRYATIVTQPPGARVIAPDGATLGLTPLEVELAAITTYLVMRDDGSAGSVTLSPERDAGRIVEVPIVSPPREKKEPPKPEPQDLKRRKVDRKKRR